MSIFTTSADKIRIFYGRHRLMVHILLALLVVIVIGSSVFAYLRHRDQAVACTGTTCPGSEDGPIPTNSEGTPTPTPSLTPARLNGVLVPSGTDNLRPLAVMIENHPDARPQWGLGSADLVYEAITEGGITRFMGVFGNPKTDIKVGPVRSARTYFVDLAHELKAFYAHVGGSNEALDKIKVLDNFYDMNQFAIGAPTFQRDSSRNVATEHTMYSSTEKLWDLATTSRNWSSEADYGAWNFADEPAVDTRPTSQSITIDFSSPQFKVGWTYDHATNSYSRTLAGKPHTDANTGKTIEAKNIILQTVNAKGSAATKAIESGGIVSVAGSGPAVVMKNGVAVSATWKKNGTDRTRYYGTDGAEITFTRGTTWVELIYPETPAALK